VVIGRVTETESREPVVGAIVYLAGTVYGSSTSTDGSFHIEAVPAGKYQIVVSHVGFERQAIPLNIAGPESVHIDIRLAPKPVQTGEVEVYRDGARILQATNLITDNTSYGQWYVGNLATHLNPAEFTLYVDDISVGSEP